MGALARKLFELIEQLPEQEQEELARLLEGRRTNRVAPAEGAGGGHDLPAFSGGGWLAGSLDRDEIYADEAGHVLPR